MAAQNIEPVYTPTYSSWLNAIEAHFAPLKKFAISGTDDPSHEYRRWRIARYLTWRNREKGSRTADLAKFSRVTLGWHYFLHGQEVASPLAIVTRGRQSSVGG